jgi:hypothetical protein
MNAKKICILKRKKQKKKAEKKREIPVNTFGVGSFSGF